MSTTALLNVESLSKQNVDQDKVFYHNAKPLIHYPTDLNNHENNTPLQFDYIPEVASQTYKYGGNSIEIKIDSSVDFQRRWELIYTRTTDQSGTWTTHTPSFLDFEGQSSILDVTIQSANLPNPVVIRGEDLKFDLLMKSDHSTRELAAKQSFGLLKKRERQELTNPTKSMYQTVCVDLNVPWDRLDRVLPTFNMSAQMSVRIRFKPLSECCKNSLNANFTIVNPIIRVTGHMTSAEFKSDIVKRLQSPLGIPLKWITHEFHAGDTKFSIFGNTAGNKVVLPLQNIRSNAVSLYFTLHLQADINDNTRLITTNFQKCSRYYLMSGTQHLTPKYSMNDGILNPGTTVSDYHTKTMHRRAYPNAMNGLDVGVIHFVMDELVHDTKFASYGGKGLGYYPNLQLVLEFDNGVRDYQGNNDFTNLYCNVKTDINQVISYKDGYVKLFIEQV